MDVLIVKHIDIEGPGLIEDCLKQEKIPYRIISLKPGIRFPLLDDLSHVVFLGGPMNVYEEERYPFLKDEDLFIKEAIQRGKLILGVCLGAQLIAKALGARVYKAPVKEIGWYEVSLTEEGLKDPLFSKMAKTFSVFQWHGDTFEIPEAGRLIATSASIPHQAFRYGEHAYGLQFHLEVTEEIIRDWMKAYEEEFLGGERPRFSQEEILKDTEKKMEAYLNQGRDFITRFLGLWQRKKKSNLKRVLYFAPINFIGGDNDQ